MWTINIYTSDVDYPVGRVYSTKLWAIACHRGKSIAEGDYEAYAYDSTRLSSYPDKDVEHLLDSEREAFRAFLHNCVQQHRMAAKSSASNAQQSESLHTCRPRSKCREYEVYLLNIDSAMPRRSSRHTPEWTLNEFARDAAFRAEENLKRPQFLVYRLFARFDLPSEVVLVSLTVY